MEEETRIIGTLPEDDVRRRDYIKSELQKVANDMNELIRVEDQLSPDIRVQKWEIIRNTYVELLNEMVQLTRGTYDEIE